MLRGRASRLCLLPCSPTQPLRPVPFFPTPCQVAEEDLQRVAEATGAQVQTTVNNLSPKALGTCARFEERQVGAERYNLFTGGRKNLQAVSVSWAASGPTCAWRRAAVA